MRQRLNWKTTGAQTCALRQHDRDLLAANPTDTQAPLEHVVLGTLYRHVRSQNHRRFLK
jgi:hypothetical protein